jgi:HPt (histidine-containing phosphotransfer) domain-containing protein
MPAPVDLTNLREMTDGDEETEKMLFEEFFLSAEECILTLKNNCTDGANETWRAGAHALKGTAINLGAFRLSDLCKKAQEDHAAALSEKQTLLREILGEYRSVKTFLKQVYA